MTHDKRWKAIIWYRTDAGLIHVAHEIEELEELHDIVECGPSFYAIDRIEVRYALSKGTETIEGEHGAVAGQVAKLCLLEGKALMQYADALEEYGKTRKVTPLR